MPIFYELTEFRFTGHPPLYLIDFDPCGRHRLNTYQLVTGNLFKWLFFFILFFLLFLIFFFFFWMDQLSIHATEFNQFFGMRIFFRSFHIIWIYCPPKMRRHEWIGIIIPFLMGQYRLRVRNLKIAIPWFFFLIPSQQVPICQVKGMKTIVLK